MSGDEYNGTLSSATFSGNVKFTIGDEDLQAIGAFDHAVIPYSDIVSMENVSYTVNVKTEKSSFTVSKLGLQCDAFYERLYAAFNRKVLRAFFVDSSPLFKTYGEYRYTESETSSSGKAAIQLYENCICILPPNDEGRRIPLCFAVGIDRKPFEFTLSLDNGNNYTFIRLGHDLDLLYDAIYKQLLALREKTMAAVLTIDGDMSNLEAMTVAKMIPEGIAAPVGELETASKTFVFAVESKIWESRAGGGYETLRGICDQKKMCVGIKFGLAGEKSDDGIIWIITPGKAEGVAAVEFAVKEEAAATFIYRYDTTWDMFRKDLNRAMEAIAFRREVIRLTDDELNKRDNSDYAMAVKRTAALRFIRNCFAGRVIHSTPENWGREINDRLTNPKF